MIQAELHQVPLGEHKYRTVATLLIEDDRNWKMDGDSELFPTDHHVITLQGRRVMFEDDPVFRARHLGPLLPTGCLVPVVTVDTEVDQEGASS
jgi:hypothetical protein